MTLSCPAHRDCRRYPAGSQDAAPETRLPTINGVALQSGTGDCFYATGAGVSALIPFGQLLRNQLLGITKNELLAIEPEGRVDDIVFRKLPRPGEGTPDEDEQGMLSAANAAEDLIESFTAEAASEVLADGNPDSSTGKEDGRWHFAAVPSFCKGLKSHTHLFDPAIKVIMKICKDSMMPRSITIKHLTGSKYQGHWRYRLGDYRLIYRPVPERRTIYFLPVGAA